MLNVHFHTLVLDGVFAPAPGGGLRFVAAPPPTPAELARLVHTIARRVDRLVARAGRPEVLLDDGPDPAGEDAGTLAALAAASVAGRSLFGAAPGARVDRRGRVAGIPVPRAVAPAQARHADFDLHAGRTVRADDRAGLERLATISCARRSRRSAWSSCPMAASASHSRSSPATAAPACASSRPSKTLSWSGASPATSGSRPTPHGPTPPGSLEPTFHFPG